MEPTSSTTTTASSQPAAARPSSLLQTLGKSLTKSLDKLTLPTSTRQHNFSEFQEYVSHLRRFLHSTVFLDDWRRTVTRLRQHQHAPAHVLGDRVHVYAQLDSRIHEAVATLATTFMAFILRDLEMLVAQFMKRAKMMMG